VTSLAATGNEEGEAAKKRKNRSRREKQERGGEDTDLQAQRGQWVRSTTLVNRQAGKGLRVGLTLTEGSEPTPTATKPMRGYTDARSTKVRQRKRQRKWRRRRRQR
jgi:hypothetical protein